MQVLKESVRQRIREAALAEFASAGAGRATMNAIARRADIGVATLYTYFESKDALLVDVIPPAFAEEFEQRLERRVRALAFLPRRNDADEARSSAQEILDFWLEHRLQVVVLLDRAEGSVYESFGQRFVEQLVRLTSAALRAENPRCKLRPEQRLVLQLIFENTRRTLATLLEQGRSARAIHAAFETFWAYQLAGLHGLTKALLQQADTRPHNS